MKKTNRNLFVILVLLVLSSCNSSLDREVVGGKGTIRNNTVPETGTISRLLQSSPSFPKNFVVNSAGGCLEVKSFFKTVGPSQRNSTSLVIPSDYVIIGGGAAIANPVPGSTNSYPSSFITASRPDFQNNAWVAQSKDHLNAEQHYLSVFAIGIKVTNISSSQLRAYIKVFSNTSSIQAHPTTTVTVPADFHMIGGGAQVNYGSGAGSLLVHSYPSSNNVWSAKSKDHSISSPASITAYAIGIKKIVDFAYCPVCQPKGLFNVTIWTSASNFVSTGLNSSNVSALQNPNNYSWIPSCTGARTTFNGYGRMLQGYFFDEDYFRAVSFDKDLKISDSGYSTSYLITIQATDCWCC